MTEMSPGWNVDYEIIPGAHKLRGIVRNITSRVCFLPPSAGYPSEYPKHPERRGGAAMIDLAHEERDAQLPFPGMVGGVLTEPTLLDVRAAANEAIN
jgi:hypothetical protein